MSGSVAKIVRPFYCNRQERLLTTTLCLLYGRQFTLNVDVLHLLDRPPADMLHPATSLDDVYKTLFPEPLLTPDQVRAFYSDRLNAVRGDDKVARLALALNRAFGGNYYKAFLMGHPGVGKSTELTRLIQRIRPLTRIKQNA